MKSVTVYKPSYIHSTAKIGEGTKIGAFCDIGKNVIIGRNCSIQCHVTISNDCKIGNNVFIGPNTSLLNDKYMDGGCQPVTVEDHVSIGGGCIILPKVTLHHDCSVGAGSIVTGDVAPNTVVWGNPAK